MSKWEAKRKAENASQKLFGVDVAIPINVTDARYRYYQWLRSWYGMGEKIVTHKCPFYQFMFWGSLLMVATFPLFIFSYIIYGITKVIGIVYPEVPEQFEALKDENPFGFSLVISIIATMITLLGSLLFLDNAIAWMGYVIHLIFAAPWALLSFIFYLLSWVAGAFGTFFGWIWGLLVVVNWAMLGYVVGWGFGILLGIAFTFWVLYRVGVFLFNRGSFNFLIKKSCNVRSKRQIRKHERILEKIKADLAVQKERDKYYNEHRAEIDAKNAKRQESWDKWMETLGAIFSPVATLFGTFFSIIGAVCMAIWWFIKKVGEIIYVAWHMITSTVSNHCPPIEFLETHEDEGELIPNRYNGGFINGKVRNMHIEPDKFPEKFKLRTKQTDYKKVRISYNLAASKDVDCNNRYHIHSIIDIKYLTKPRAKKTVATDVK